jgi:hypothetical protein
MWPNLERFEFFERWTGELRMDVSSKQTPAGHLAGLTGHAEAIGLREFFPIGDFLDTNACGILQRLFYKNGENVPDRKSSHLSPFWLKRVK